MCEYPEYARRVQRRARKTHRCCECRGQIDRGEKYTYVFGVWSGDAMTFKTCSDCNQLRFEYDVAHSSPGQLEEVMPFEELGAWLYESDETEMLRRFRDIQVKRGAKHPIEIDDLLPEAPVSSGQVGED